jgi:hypothetical protein
VRHKTRGSGDISKGSAAVGTFVDIPAACPGNAYIDGLTGTACYAAGRVENDKAYSVFIGSSRNTVPGKVPGNATIGTFP